MKGLMLKDLFLLKGNKMLYVIVFVIVINVAFTSVDAAFIVSYVTMIMSMMVISTISYDDFDKSNVFLLTLPITRKQYVAEKYCLGFLLTGIGWLISSLVALFLQYMDNASLINTDWFIIIGMLYFIGCVFLVFMIPLQLKFGGENGGIVMIACAFVLILIGSGIIALCNFLHIDLNFIYEYLNKLQTIQIMLGMIILVGISLMISYGISLHILLKKQF